MNGLGLLLECPFMLAETVNGNDECLFQQGDCARLALKSLEILAQGHRFI